MKEAQAVAAGTPILTLDGTQLAAQRAMMLRQRAETLARLDRLLAEVRSEDKVTYRPALTALADEIATLPEILADETSLFAARKMTLQQTTSPLAERTRQTEALIGGRSKQLAAAREQIALIHEELDAQEKLLDQGLTQKTRVLPCGANPRSWLGRSASSKPTLPRPEVRSRASRRAAEARSRIP